MGNKKMAYIKYIMCIKISLVLLSSCSRETYLTVGSGSREAVECSVMKLKIKNSVLQNERKGPVPAMLCMVVDSVKWGYPDVWLNNVSTEESNKAIIIKKI